MLGQPLQPAVLSRHALDRPGQRVGITDFSYPRPFIPKNERSLWRTFVLGERKFPGTFVPRPFRSQELSFLGNESSWELSFLGPFIPGNFRSHCPIGLVAALLWVLMHVRLWLHPYDVDSIVNFSANVVRRSTRFCRPAVCVWCAYNCVTAHKMLEVGLMNMSLWIGIITFIHFAFLFNRKKQHDHTLSLLSLFLENN